MVSTGPNPEWDESFAWSFESPPKGQKLHISCKNKSKMGKVNEPENLFQNSKSCSKFLALDVSLMCQLTLFLVNLLAELIWKSNNPDRPCRDAGVSSWRVHSVTGEQKWAFAESGNRIQVG